MIIATSYELYLPVDQNITRGNRYSQEMTVSLNNTYNENVLFTMIEFLVENRNQITIRDSILSINSKNLDFNQKLNYCMEFLTHIPFIYKYNKTQTKILLDYFHLEEEIKLKTNLELLRGKKLTR